MRQKLFTRYQSSTNLEGVVYVKQDNKSSFIFKDLLHSGAEIFPVKYYNVPTSDTNKYRYKTVTKDTEGVDMSHGLYIYRTEFPSASGKVVYNGLEKAEEAEEEAKAKATTPPTIPKIIKAKYLK